MQGRGRPRLSTNANFVNRPTKQSNYVPLQSGGRRHEFSTAAFPAPAAFPALAAGEYFGHILCAFERTFGSGDDEEPTATASNNYQTPRVMNGSKIQNFQAKISIKNRSNIGGFLGVYRIALSFYDALVWNTLISGSCPVTMDTTTTAPDERGKVSTKTVTTTLVTKNNWNNYKTVQHYMEYLGDIQIPTEDAGNSGLVEIMVNDIPPKCRRSNTGMFYMYLFHNDSDQNGAETLQINSVADISFDEIPSDQRLPWVN